MMQLTIMSIVMPDIWFDVEIRIFDPLIEYLLSPFIACFITMVAGQVENVVSVELVSVSSFVFPAQSVIMG